MRVGRLSLNSVVNGGESVVTEKKYQEMYVNSPGKGVVDKLKGMVGTWFTNPAENQSSQGK